TRSWWRGSAGTAGPSATAPTTSSSPSAPRPSPCSPAVAADPISAPPRRGRLPERADELGVVGTAVPVTQAAVDRVRRGAVAGAGQPHRVAPGGPPPDRGPPRRRECAVRVRSPAPGDAHDSDRRMMQRSTRGAPVRSLDRGADGTQARLLLVEDDERIRQALGLALADEGCEVVEAGSGEEAFDLLETTRVDVVLLDLMLPGVDGLDVCRTLRARGDLPIIIVSARADSADVIEGLEAGAD